MIRSAGGAQSVDDLMAFDTELLGPDRLTSDRLSCAEHWWVVGSVDEIEILG